jgi:anti-sigma factor RsiW
MSDPRRTPERLIDGLLGPAGAELTCEQCFEMLDVYVDHELAGDDADERIPGMREHLQGCPACAEEHTSLRDLMATIEGEQTR